MIDPAQQQNTMLDQDQSRAALGVITYLMTHTLPPARMQSQAQPMQQTEQQPEKPQEKPAEQPQQQPPEDKSAEIELNLSKKIDDIKKELDEKHKLELDSIKSQIEQALNEPEQA